MKVLKGLVLSLLSLLLFLSLSIFGVVLTLSNTLLDRNFINAEMNKLDMPVVTRQLADTLIIPMLPQELQFLRQPMYDAVADFAPSLKEQLRAGVNSSYDYFLGKSQKLGFAISLEPLKTSLRDKARQAFLQNLPPQLANLPPAQVDQYFNQFYQQYSQQIPSSFTVDEASLGTQTMATVKQVRQYIGYAQIAYWALIGFMLLLITAIVLISRNVKKVTRELGVNFLIYGALGYASIFVAEYLRAQYLTPSVSSLAASLAIPQALLSWLSQLLADVSALAPLQVFSIALAAIGIILIVVSFVYRPRPAQA